MKSSFKAAVWRLRVGQDRRFRSGHPWVYSNELAESPKGIEPGQAIELRDASGKFLARGFGNPISLISFRAVTRDSEVADPFSEQALLQTLLKARELRDRTGISRYSHRLCFGEADGLPGLIIDCYRLSRAQVFSIQAHTAGMNRILPQIEGTLKSFVQAKQENWDETGIILRNDVGIRKLEGLQEEVPRVLRSPKAKLDLGGTRIQILSVTPDESPLEFHVDLIQGQKTGFFLDQFANIQLAAQRLCSAPQEEFKILDLCSYVGQWGAQLGGKLAQAGFRPHVTALDSSSQALEFAKLNLENLKLPCELIKADVLRDLGSLPERGFDLVVSDPPALIKGRKDIPAGTHAYLQLNTQVFRCVKEEGAVISCSCSALLEEEDFLKTLSKAAFRNHRHPQWIARGMQSPDHPVLAEFPEGRYLKAWIGLLP